MLVSFVVRLVREDLHSGVIAGEVHNVATGEQAIIRSFDDLLAVFSRGVGAASTAPRPNSGDVL